MEYSFEIKYNIDIFKLLAAFIAYYEIQHEGDKFEEYIKGISCYFRTVFFAYLLYDPLGMYQEHQGIQKTEKARWHRNRKERNF